MKDIKLIVALLFVSFGFVNAQTFGDAVFLSSTDVYGSARTVGVNGAFGAMGGDYSSTMINPAGIGQYKKGEFVFTPSHETIEMAGNGATPFAKGKLGFDQIGFVFTSTGDKFKKNNFVIGYNKTQAFTGVFSVNERSTESITDWFMAGADGKDFESISDYAYGAYEAGAIFYDKEDPNLIYKDDYPDGVVLDKSVQTRYSGSAGEVSLGWGGNYNDKLNLGVVIGIPMVSFEELKSYNQVYRDGAEYSDLRFNKFNKTSGTGVNLKLGATYTPNNRFRLGLAVHSPSLLYMSDEFSDTVEYHSSAKNTPNQIGQGESGNPEYQFVTPFKAIGSIGNVFKAGKLLGFVNLDFEHQNYNSVKYDLTTENDDPQEIISTEALNAELRKNISSVNIIRAGGELAYEYFRLRGGYSYSSSAVSDVNHTGWSLGAGYSGDNSFIDIAYRVSSMDNIQSNGSFPLANLGSVSNKRTKGLFAVTVGFRM